MKLRVSLLLGRTRSMSGNRKLGSVGHEIGDEPFAPPDAHTTGPALPHQL